MNPDDTRDPHETGDTDDVRDTDTTRPLAVDEPIQPTRPRSAPATETDESRDLDDPQRVSGRHPLSISYLVAGLIFLGIAASWGLRGAGVVDAGSSSWLFPLTLVVVGAIGLAASVVSSARRP